MIITTLIIKVYIDTECEYNIEKHDNIDIAKKYLEKERVEWLTKHPDLKDICLQ